VPEVGDDLVEVLTPQRLAQNRLTAALQPRGVALAEPGECRVVAARGGEREAFIQITGPGPVPGIPRARPHSMHRFPSPRVRMPRSRHSTLIWVISPRYGEV
jgi:hypothetical protein